MKTTKILLILLALLIVSVNAFAATVSIPTMNGNAGAIVDIPVNIDNATGVAGFQITVQYNAAVLNCTTVLKGSLISTGWDAMTVNTAVPGQIFGSSNSSDLSELNGGGGTLALIRCTVVGAGGSSTSLHFVASPATQLSNGLGDAVPATFVDGSFTSGACIPSVEICDGIDNDCDGQVDNGIPSVPTTCGIGTCTSTGQSACTSGVMIDSCTSGTPQVEGPFDNPTCSDVLDNDCDGLTDAADPSCVDCIPSQEVCDGLDNDCDGQVDNGIAPVPTTCGTGACAASGETTCQAGQLVDNCTPGTPQVEGPFSNPTCSDVLDNDCDGLTDAADQGCVRLQTGMDHWLGKWFTIKRSMKGSSFRATDSKYLIDKNAGSGYMHIWGWDPDTEDLHFDYYEFREDDDLWHTYTDALHFFAGTDNKFVFWYTSGDATFVVNFNGLIDGKVKNGILQNASLKTLGGLYCDIHDDNTRYSAGEQIVTGKMIDASKVPVPDNLILPH